HAPPIPAEPPPLLSDGGTDEGTPTHPGWGCLRYAGLVQDRAVVDDHAETVQVGSGDRCAVNVRAGQVCPGDVESAPHEHVGEVRVDQARAGQVNAVQVARHHRSGEVTARDVGLPQIRVDEVPPGEVRCPELHAVGVNQGPPVLLGLGLHHD